LLTYPLIRVSRCSIDQLVYSPKSLGNAIKRQRKAKKLSQCAAGVAFRLDQTTISSIEQGAPGTRVETLFRVLAALHLEMVIRPKKNSGIKNGDTW
jgi:HTH-type transcriptional regulator/antitoxin HipB